MPLRHIALTLAAAVILSGIISAAAFCDETTIIIDKPFTVGWLGGTVVDPSGAVMPSVRVEECTEVWKSVKRTVETNRDGHFAFHTAGEGMHYLKFSQSGFHTVLVRVKVRWFSSEKFRLDMQVS
jgi:hypothetical protein